MILVPFDRKRLPADVGDHSNDEEGYLVEMKSDHDPAFAVRAVVAPDTNSFGYAFEPPERQATLRVRAFYYGQPSAMAQATTETNATR